MTGVLIVLALLSAVGGFLSIPHYLERLLPMPDAAASLHHLETPLLVLSIVIAFAGLALAGIRLRRRRRARGAPAAAPAGPAPRAVRQVFRRRGL
jgi:NADH-quinone oxidoreductase subunit L